MTVVRDKTIYWSSQIQIVELNDDRAIGAENQTELNRMMDLENRDTPTVKQQFQH